VRVEGDYWRDGAVCVRGALDGGLVDLARAAVEANLADLGPLAKRASPDGDGAFVEDFCSWTRLPELRALALEPRIAEVAAAVMGTDGPVRLYHDHVLVKEPGTRQRTPWHQDLPYYNVDGRLNVSLWIPVDPVPVSSTLQLVGGSHLGPWFMPRTFLDGRAKWFPEGSLAELPDVEADPERYPVLAWELEPGDLVAFHMLTLHASAGVDGPDRRRVVSLRYLGDDMRHAVRDWETSPPFPGLAEELPDGAPLDHPLFPVVLPGR
jgi:ectoine hydroxylase-related dioxygenase (phytanoyl-CoA dioxygenase family)